MTYRPATRRLPVWRRSAVEQAMTRHHNRRSTFTELDVVPAEVRAQWNRAGVTSTDGWWLADTFSTRALTQLAANNTSTRDYARLRTLADLHLSRLRGYLSKTRLPVADIDWLMTHDVSSTSVVAWTQRLPWQHASTNLADVLRNAVVLHGLPDEQVSGWVRLANRFEVPYSTAATDAWVFLGGPTALMVRAGLTPTEATQMMRHNRVDTDALAMLAGLRAGIR